jgi:hypothetical protein
MKEKGVEEGEGEEEPEKKVAITITIINKDTIDRIDMKNIIKDREEITIPRDPIDKKGNKTPMKE